MDAEVFLHPPTHHPHSIPSSHHTASLRGHLGFSLNPWLVETTHPSSTRIQILIRKIDSTGESGLTHRQTDREKGRWRAARTGPHPLIYVSALPHQQAGGLTGIKRRCKGGMNRGEERKMKGRSWLSWKTNRRPVCDWHLVIVTSSSCLCHTQQTHKWISPGKGLWLAVISASRHLSSAFHITFHTQTRTKDLTSSRAVQETFNQMTVNCSNTKPNANNFLRLPPLFISSESLSVKIHSPGLLSAPPTLPRSPLYHFLFGLCPFPSP